MSMNGVSNDHCGQMNGSCCNGAAATNGHCNGDVCANGNPQNASGTKTYETELKCVDGNWAVAHAAYRTNDCAYIFPITPSSVSIMQKYAGELQDTIQVLLHTFIFLFSL
jgi:hypothetical protein